MRMSAVIANTPFADRLRRVLAGGCAALVLALTIFAASPVAHDWLHDGDHDHGGSGDTCAVVMFAGGVSLPGALFVPAPPEAFSAAILPVAATDVFLVSPRYLRQPERGPPVSRIG